MVLIPDELSAALKEAQSDWLPSIMCALQERFGAPSLALAMMLNAEGERIVAPRLTCLADVKPERVSWLWADRIPYGKLTLIDGDPGLGKTTISLDIAARLTRGAKMPFDPSPVEPADVIVMSAEDGLADTIRPRLEAAGADLNHVHFLEINDGSGIPRAPVLPNDIPLIEEAIKERNARLVIIDPLMAYLSGKVNANNDQDVRRALAALVAMAERTGAAIVVLRHLNKLTGSLAMYRGGGSIGIIGAARSALLVTKHPADPEKRVIARVKCNLSRHADAVIYSFEDADGVGYVNWQETCQFTADGLLAAQEAERAPSRSDAEEFLLTFLADGPRLTADVKEAATKAGIKERTLSRAKTTLHVKACRMGKAWGMTLPSESTLPMGDGQEDVAELADMADLTDLEGGEDVNSANSAMSATDIKAANAGTLDDTDDEETPTDPLNPLRERVFDAWRAAKLEETPELLLRLTGRDVADLRTAVAEGTEAELNALLRYAQTGKMP